MTPARADLVGLMVGAPLLIASNAMPRLTIGVLIVLVPLAVLRLLAARGSTRLAWPAIGILAMALVGTAVSPDPAVSLQKLSGIVVGVLALAAVQAHGRSAGGFAAVMIVFVALATVAVAAGGAALLPAVAQMLPARAALQRTVPAATVHPNGVAGLVLMVLPGLLLLVISRAVWVRGEAALAPRHRTRWTQPAVLRAAGAAICLAMLATLVASRSRSGIVGLAAAIALALGLRLIAGRPSRRIWIAVSAALVAAAVTIGSIAIHTGSRLPSDLATRVDIWNRAVMMIGAFPLTGVGLNAFRSLLPLVAPSPYMSPGIDVAHAHNIFLQTALDLGLPGLCAYLALLAVAVANCLRIAGGTSPVRRAVAVALAANLAGIHLFGLTDALPIGGRATVLFWLNLGLIAALEVMETTARGAGATRRAVIGSAQ